MTSKRGMLSKYTDGNGQAANTGGNFTLFTTLQPSGVGFHRWPAGGHTCVLTTHPSASIHHKSLRKE